MEFNFKSNSPYSYMRYGGYQGNIRKMNTILYQNQRNLSTLEKYMICLVKSIQLSLTY